MKQEIYRGSTIEDSSQYKGWIVGSFVERPEHIRSTPDVEVKWGLHEAGESRDVWSYSTSATSMTVLVTGKIILEFPNESITLTNMGDYVIFAPGVLHRWRAEDDSLSMTVRWPSRPGDMVELTDLNFPASFQSTALSLQPTQPGN